MKKALILLFVTVSIHGTAQTENSSRPNLGIGVEVLPMKTPYARSVELQLLYNRWQCDIGWDHYIQMPAYIRSFDLLGRFNPNVQGYHLGMNYCYRDRKNKYYIGAEYSNWKWKNSPAASMPHNYYTPPKPAPWEDEVQKEKNHFFSLTTGANWRISRFFYYDLSVGAGYLISIPELEAFNASNTTFRQLWPVVNTGFKYMISRDELARERSFKYQALALGVHTNVFLSKSVDVQWGLSERVSLDGGIDFFGPPVSNPAIGFHAGSSVYLTRSTHPFFIAARYTGWKTSLFAENLDPSESPQRWHEESSKHHFMTLSAGKDWRLMKNLFLDTRLGIGLDISKNYEGTAYHAHAGGTVETRNWVEHTFLPNAEVGLKYYLPIRA